MVASGKRPHRVTEFFAGTEEGSLRPDMELHAAGHGMTERLACEIGAYQLCKVDDTWAEAAHRDVSSFGKRHTAASVAYTCACQRLGQILRRTGNMTPQELRQFYQCMRKHTAIAQTLLRPARELRPVRKPRQFVQAFVYRYDAAKMKDWDAEFGGGLAFLCGRPAGRKSVVIRMQIEYLESLVAEGQTLSLPQIDDATAEAANGVSLQELHNLWDRRPADSDRFFDVVDLSPARKKHLRSATAASFDNDSKVVTIQRMASWAGEGAADAAANGQLLSCHDGYPDAVDILAEAPWPVFRGGLRRWHVEDSTQRGCLALSRPAPVRHEPDNLAIEDLPAICLLEALADAGWQRGQTPEAHTALSPKTFTVSDPLASKAYLRCLLRLDDLLGPGKMVELRPKQSAMYYNCILATERPQLVPLGQAAAVYKSLLDSGDPADGQPVEAIEDGHASGDEMLLQCRPAPAAIASRVRRPSQQAASGAKRQKCWQSLVVAAQPVPAIGDAVGEGQLPPQAQELAIVAAEGAGSVAAASEPSEAQPAQAAVEPVEGVAGMDAKGRVTLHGVAVLEEKHGIIGESNYYRRCLVTCQHHGQPDDLCGRTRKYDTREAASSGLGDLEPLAFLGCWLRACGQHESKESHKRYVPTIAERQSYARAHLDWKG